jgi:hypothetical protein
VVTGGDVVRCSHIVPGVAAAAAAAALGLMSHVWQQVVHAINTAEPLNEGSIRDMFDEACEDQVTSSSSSRARGSWTNCWTDKFGKTEPT